MIERVPWERLPEELRVDVEAHVGPVVSAEVVGQGLNCSAALALVTEQRGRLFLKGVRLDDEPAVAALATEARLNATVRRVGPAVVHSARLAGWACMVFTYVSDRNADLGPGSPDLPAVADLLRRMERLAVPDPPLPSLADRFGAHALPHERAALAGGALLHTDTNPHNLLIDATGRAHVVDWAMPATGPAWVDAAYTAVRLVECGQPMRVARAWLEGFESWRTADPAAVGAFVEVVCRWWSETVGEADAVGGNGRFRGLLER
ncbi:MULTISPECIES: phosphotransferase [unclassified Streptomyces]|uniref:phosphotransferase n=1 Tax=unclassified Streptomyces TaxID=2593676 RepID=UPI002E290901|nr:phosphotransferase [Streptomyces sp. NBC_00223]